MELLHVNHVEANMCNGASTRNIGHEISQVYSVVRFHNRPIFTNESGCRLFGVSWKTVDFLAMAKFHGVLLQMAHVKRSRMEAYFSSDSGDEIVKSLGMSYNQFNMLFKA